MEAITLSKHVGQTNRAKLARLIATFEDPISATWTDREIAEHCGVARNTVQRHRTQHGFRKERPPAQPKRVSTWKQAYAARLAQVADFLETPEALDTAEYRIARRFHVDPRMVNELWQAKFARDDEAIRAASLVTDNTTNHKILDELVVGSEQDRFAISNLRLARLMPVCLKPLPLSDHRRLLKEQRRQGRIRPKICTVRRRGYFGLSSFDGD